MNKVLIILLTAFLIFICTVWYLGNQPYLSEHGKYSYTIVNKLEYPKYDKYFILFMDDAGNIYKNQVADYEYNRYKIGHIIKLNNPLK